MPETLAELVDIHKEYGQAPVRVPVLRGVSFTVQAGEWVALVGRSGSGKSTLLHIMGGLDRRFSGGARVLGRDLAQLSDGALAALRNQELGFVFQSFNLLDHLTIAENVALPRFFAPPGSPTHAIAHDRTAIAERTREALAQVGLDGRQADKPGALSGGQKQRVAIARALFTRPKMLLADEPTGNLDAHTGEQIIALFGELNRAGLTLVVVTHEERVSRAAGRVVRLADGALADHLHGVAEGAS